MANHVVFVHGFLDAASVWETVRARLEAESISKRALDLPGMGGTVSVSAPISLAGGVRGIRTEFGPC
jgi:pimeloyl-ACP methyl ester carboxylesterase